MNHWIEKIQTVQWELDRLPVTYLQRKGFKGWKAYLTCSYGSMIRQIQKQNQALLLPDGSAHFLEHRLFDIEGTDASTLFSKLGAEANAYTSRRVMGFYFSTINHPIEALQILNDLVLNIRTFNPKAIETEKKIIESEMMMYEDDPFSKGYQRLLEQLFWVHPVRINIVGSTISIALINQKLLESIHKTFFTPHRCKLFVCGPEDPSKFQLDCEKKLVCAKWNHAELPLVDVCYLEPFEVKKPFDQFSMPITKDLLFMGFKTKKNSLSLRDSLIGEMIGHILFGSISPFYDLLYSKELIDDSFYFSYDWDKDFGVLVLAGYTPDSSNLRKKIEKEIRSKTVTGISKEEFEIIKNYFIGSTYTMIDKPSDLMMHLTNLAWFNNQTWDDYIHEIKKLEVEDINRELKIFLDLDFSAVTLIHP